MTPDEEHDLEGMLWIAFAAIFGGVTVLAIIYA